MSAHVKMPLEPYSRIILHMANATCHPHNSIFFSRISTVMKKIPQRLADRFDVFLFEMTLNKHANSGVILFTVFKQDKERQLVF